MATSNSTNYNQNRNEIITDALILIGALGEADTASSAAITFGSSILNKMVKSWEGQGIHLWTETEGTVFLTDNKNVYTLGTDRAGDNVVETTLSAAGSGTTLTVTSTTGMTAADNIVIELDDNTLQATTIVSVGSSTQLTITATLTGAAASGNNIFTYTTAMGRPLMITGARYRDSEGVDRLLKIEGRTKFMSIPSKHDDGPVNTIFYGQQRDSGLLYLWPTPEDVGATIKVSYLRTIQDFDSSTDNPDFPVEWLETVTYNLAVRLGSAYGKRMSRDYPDVIQLANVSLGEMRLWDVGQGSVRIGPNYRYDS